MTDLIIGFTLPAIVAGSRYRQLQTAPHWIISATENNISRGALGWKSCQMGGPCCNVKIREEWGGWGFGGGCVCVCVCWGGSLTWRSWRTPALPPPDISIFPWTELLSRLLAPAHSWYARRPLRRRWTLSKRSQGIKQSWNVTPSLTAPLTHTHTHTHTHRERQHTQHTHTLSCCTPPADHCQITICIIICSAQRRKLTPKFYGSTNCDNQCFIGYTKGKMSLTIALEELSFSLPSRPLLHQLNSITLLAWLLIRNNISKAV